MDLENLKIEGVIFNKETQMDMLLQNPLIFNAFFHAYENSPIIIFNEKRTVIDGHVFYVKIYFYNEKLYEIQLFPIKLQMEDPEYPDKEYQEEKKKIIDSFLRKSLGQPTKENESVLYYEFDWGSIASVIFLHEKKCIHRWIYPNII